MFVAGTAIRVVASTDATASMHVRRRCSVVNGSPWKWGPFKTVVNGPGASYSIVVNGPRAWKTYLHLFSFIIDSHKAMILRGVILFEFLF